MSIIDMEELEQIGKAYLENLVHIKPRVVEPRVVNFKQLTTADFPAVVDDKLYRLSSKDKKDKLLYLNCGFDTEFCTIEVDGRHEAYIYAWQFSINDLVVIGRDIEEFPKFLKMVKSHYKLKSTRKIRVWVANLGCEYQFVKHYVNITDMFCKSARRPYYFEVDNCINFQDALQLVGFAGGLAHLAEKYCVTRKLTGDIDHSKIRNSLTVLSEKELKYMINDVVVLSEFNEYIVETYLKQGFKLPITKTGMLSQSIKDRYADFENTDSGKWFRRGLKSLYPENFEEYSDFRNLTFRGGLCCSNIVNKNRKLSKVYGVDLSSSYPAAALQFDFPMTGFIPASALDFNIKTIEDLDQLKEKYIYKIKCTFYNIERSINKDGTYNIPIENIKNIIEYKETKDLISTINDCNIKSIEHDICSADYITVWLTDVDLENYKKFYTWDDIDIWEVEISIRGRLPAYLTWLICYYYNKKDRLKREGKKDTIEYEHAKEMLNSLYGLCVKKLNFTETKKIDGVWVTRSSIKESSTWSDVQQKYWSSIQGKLLAPRWGVWISAYARNRLLNFIYELGEDFVYCDTDSIYITNYEKYRSIFDDYNRKIETYNKENNFPTSIGKFDPIEDSGDHYYDYFKTIGKKRYIKTKDGVTTATIAGLNKIALPNFVEKENKDVYDVFDDDMKIPVEYSETKLHEYNDGETERVIVDYNGVACKMHSRSSYCIYDVPFKFRTITDICREFSERAEKQALGEASDE